MTPNELRQAGVRVRPDLAALKQFIAGKPRFIPMNPDDLSALIARVERAEAALRETCAALDSVLKSDGLLDAEEIALDHGLAALAALEAS